MNESDRTPYPAERARQGHIVLRRPWQRVVFVAGLVLTVIAALILGFAR